MKIRVVSVDDFGGGYCVITRDDGSTFGQQFRELPVEDASAFNAAIQKLADDALARTAPPVARQKSPAVDALVGEEWQVAKAEKMSGEEIVP